MSLNNTRLNNTRPQLGHQGSQTQHQTSLVGNYPNQIRMPSNNMMSNPQMNRQFPNSTNGPNMYNNNSTQQQQRPLLNQQQQQTSLLGNRPPLIPNQPLLRSTNLPTQAPVNQMGLLNNPPRMPLNNPNMMQRQDWMNNSSMNQQSNGILPTNPQMMMLNQQRLQTQSMPITPTTPNNNQSQFQFNALNQNGLLSNQSFQAQSLSAQQQQQQQQPQAAFNQMMHPNFSNQTMSTNHQLLNQNPLQMQSHMNHSSHSATSLLPQQQAQPQTIASDMHHLNPHMHDSYSYQRTNSGNSLMDPQLMPQMHPTPTSHHTHHSHQSNQSKLSEIEFQEALEKNRIVSGSALARAVQDASIGKIKFILNNI